jgi:hypothetical protein
MIALDIPRHRLHNQRIGEEKFELPGQAVAGLGAVQAQDYASAKWAIGLRCRDATDATIEEAIANKTILRTWLMRGTLQVVATSDVRWMLRLLAPRIMANSARRHRQLELDDGTFAHSYEALTRELRSGKRLTRAEIMHLLEQAGISTSGQRGYHILRQAGLEGLICFGPMQDNEQTFVLLDEWAPPNQQMERGDALAKLAGRYFGSRGPATLQDFAWWSGLSAADARAGLTTAKIQLREETVDGQTYWLPENNSISKDPSPAVYLLPAYDEYYLGYKARNAVLDSKYDKQAVSSHGVFRPMIVLDGQIVGIWKRTLKRGSVIITPSPFNPLTKVENQALLVAANQYGAFLGLAIALEHRKPDT